MGWNNPLQLFDYKKIEHYWVPRYNLSDQTKHKEVPYMLKVDYTQNILGIKDVKVENVENFGDSKVIELRFDRKEHFCPRCNSITDYVHDYRTQFVKDIPSFGLKTILKIHKRRYVCKNCGKRFNEKIDILPKYQRTTNRLWGHVLAELGETTSMKTIAERNNISIPTVSRIIDITSYGISSLPEVISIDEFKGNSGGNKYQCILTNPRKRQVLDILPKRTVEDLSAYFSKFDNRRDVKYVVMDMSAVFRSMAESCFPNAEIVVDKFHVQRLVTWAFEDIRKTVQSEFSNRRRKYFKHSRFLLMKDQESLSENELEQISHMLEVSKTLAQAYYLMHEFRKVLKSNDEYEAKRNLANWFMTVGATDSKQFRRFHTCVDTFIKWEKPILNAFKTGLSNGYTEGCNNRIKVIKRNAYGYRNFDRFKKRILHIMAA